MDDKIKKEIILEAIEIADNLIPASEKNNDLKSKFKGFKTQPRTISFDDRLYCVHNYPGVYNQLRGKICKELRKDKPFPKGAFSDEYVEDCIDELICTILKKGIVMVCEDPLKVVFLFDMYFQDFTVYLPLAGIRIFKGSYTLGNMVLRIMGREKVESMYNGPFVPPKDFQEWVGKPCAEFKMLAEPSVAIKQAKIELDKVLNLIHYSIALLYPNSGMYVGLLGEVSKRSRKRICADSKGECVSYGASRSKGSFSFTLNESNFRKMNEKGVNKISKIMQKPGHTDFEHTILLGLHWFADAHKQTELKNKFLSLMISLEIFLTPSDKQESITLSIAENAAIILKPEGERKSFSEEIKNFYNKRSVIVHGKPVQEMRKRDILYPEDVEYLTTIIGDLIQWMVIHKDSYNLKKELLAEIKQYKISGAVFEP